MNAVLNNEEKAVLKVLYEELDRNPQTSLIGINETVLGYKVGAYLGIGVIYSVAHLEELGLVTRQKNNVIITQKGILVAKPKITPQKNNRIVVFLRDNILVALIIAILGGLIVAAILTHWHL